jgi:hypothetical protein
METTNILDTFGSNSSRTDEVQCKVVKGAHDVMVLREGIHKDDLELQLGRKYYNGTV